MGCIEITFSEGRVRRIDLLVVEFIPGYNYRPGE
jgi:hypothetical protein